MPSPSIPPQGQPSVALPVQPGATGVVRSKRKKKNPTQNQQPGQAPPQFPVQPMMPYTAPGQVPLNSTVLSVPPVTAQPVQMVPTTMTL
jgi:hypothetical protein